MLNKWRKNYRYRIPVKLNFDFALSITAGFDNLSIQVGSSNGNVKCFLFEDILLPNAACKQAVQVTYCNEKQRHLNLVRTQRFKRFAELFMKKRLAEGRIPSSLNSNLSIKLMLSHFEPESNTKR